MEKQNKQNLGSAGEGASHWLHQRFSAVFLVLCTYWIFSFSSDLVNSEAIAMIDAIKRPFNLVMLLSFVLIGFYHGFLGMQVVIEDYIHNRFARIFLLWAVKSFCIFSVLAFIVAIMQLLNLA